jgi:2-oxoglutarate dehydrogenase E1 component
MSRDPVSLSGNLGFIDELWRRYLEDPASLDASWREVFSNGVAELPVRRRIAAAEPAEPAEPAAAAAHGPSHWPLVHAHRARGHLAADLDPLDMLERPGHDELEPETYGFSGADLDRVIDTDGVGGMPETASVRELLAHLRRVYCGPVGLEFMHITTPKKKDWLARRMEIRFDSPISDDATRIRMLSKLIAAETFERFIHTKFPGTKRFSLEGGESLIPLIEQVLDNAGRLGAIEAVLGMAHRGRLNVLNQVMGRRARDIFSEFEDIEPEATLGGGDVKYHLGYSADRMDADGNHLHVSLAFNPSHLEAIDPVVCGRVRAKQRRHSDWERRQVVGVLIHGDAAFAGQGLVAETLQLSNLTGYRTGGTVHIIVNNQIGFTASPREQRSTPYCTDIAQMIQCPIWHVNGEDLDAVARVVAMAMDYRHAFQSDVVIDMFCYRKFGHNEMDEPGFTQPLMYKRIQEKQPIDVAYAERLFEQGVTDEEQVDDIRRSRREHYEAELDAGRRAERRPRISAMGGVWSSYRGGADADCPESDTGVPLDTLRQLAAQLTRVPDGAKLHPKILRLLEARAEMGRGERPLDWGMAEILSYATLLWEGTNIRLTGQDSARGTFSHRHALVTDIVRGTEHMPLSGLHPDQGECRIYDSPLSEAAVLGFEWGYSLDYPDGLVIWEAQFGDFANGAQVIIDQFISTSEDKWNRLSGLVMLLPHGYEGQGPEHSSARPERFLQNAAEDNVQIVQPSTAAQIFHLLRRQVRRAYRKPLIVLSPKSLLRLKQAGSPIEELTSGHFRRVLGDDDVDPGNVERIFLCSGRIYYDLVEERSRREDERTAIIRLEQLYPFQSGSVVAAIETFEKAAEMVWVQDEPANMGPRDFIRPRLEALAGDRRLRLVSREASASPATGSSKAHGIEQRRLLDEAFSAHARGS